MPMSHPNRVPSPDPPAAPARPDRQDYRTLSEFRYLIRCFLEFSQVAAAASGLTSRQHQALLAIKGFPRDAEPTIGELAERLRIQHHSMVELVDRLGAAGLVRRRHHPADRRRVLVGLTDAAEARLADLSATHLDELRRLRPALLRALNRVCRERDGGDGG
jgi:DNA-binding MarR family transcriptional regulator